MECNDIPCNGVHFVHRFDAKNKKMMRRCAYPFEDRFRIIWEHQAGFLGAHIDFIEYLLGTQWCRVEAWVEAWVE